MSLLGREGGRGGKEGGEGGEGGEGAINMSSTHKQKAETVRQTQKVLKGDKNLKINSQNSTKPNTKDN